MPLKKMKRSKNAELHADFYSVKKVKKNCSKKVINQILGFSKPFIIKKKLRHISTFSNCEAKRTKNGSKILKKSM
jgi:hypothetical protein